MHWSQKSEVIERPRELGVVLLCLGATLCSLEGSAASLPKRYRLGFSTAYTLYNYSEVHEFQPSGGISGFKETAITLKGSMRYYLVPPFIDSEINAFYTALPMGSNVSGTSARFLGVNARAGWVFPGLPRGMSLTLMVGWYYLTMFVDKNSFGFENIQGPQVFPELSWILYLPNDVPVVLTTYYKYSPVAPDIKSLTYSIREISTGLNFRYPVGGIQQLPRYAYLKAVSLGVNYATVNPRIQTVRLVTIQNTTWSIYLGYDF